MSHLVKVVSILFINNYLKHALIIVIITEEEDAKLNQAGVQRNMPKEYFDKEHILYRDKWARYHVSDIYKNIY